MHDILHRKIGTEVQGDLQELLVSAPHMAAIQQLITLPGDFLCPQRHELCSPLIAFLPQLTGLVVELIGCLNGGSEFTRKVVPCRPILDRSGHQLELLLDFREKGGCIGRGPTDELVSDSYLEKAQGPPETREDFRGHVEWRTLGWTYIENSIELVPRFTGRERDARRDARPAGDLGAEPCARRARGCDEDGELVGAPHRRSDSNLVGARHERARSPLLGLAKVIAVMATNVGLMRLKKELKMLYEDPPPGISAWAQEENFHEIEAGAAHIGISVRALVADQHADC